jgi:hypothetical protein
MFPVEHTIATSKAVTIRVNILRSTKPQRCPVCGLRRILIALALSPAGLSPETWACAEDTGLRVSGRSEAPAPLPGHVSLWAEAEASVALDKDPEQGTHYIGDGHPHDEPLPDPAEPEQELLAHDDPA